MSKAMEIFRSHTDEEACIAMLLAHAQELEADNEKLVKRTQFLAGQINEGDLIIKDLAVESEHFKSLWYRTNDELDSSKAENARLTNQVIPDVAEGRRQYAMTLKEFAMLAGVELITDCQPDWGGKFAYKTKDRPLTTIAGFKSEKAVYLGWLAGEFGNGTLMYKAMLKLLKDKP